MRMEYQESAERESISKRARLESVQNANRTPESVLGAALAVGTPLQLDLLKISSTSDQSFTPSLTRSFTPSSKGSHNGGNISQRNLKWSMSDYDSPNFHSPVPSARDMSFVEEPPPAPKPCRVTSAFPMSRTNSLDETKVLLTTTLSRSDSIMMPELFKFTQHFEFLKVVGRSEYSEVWLVRHRRKQTMYAIKRRNFVSRGDRERCLREMLAVVELDAHPNIVMYYRAWQEDANLCIQMEYCEGGTLKQELEKQNGKCLGFPELLSLTCQLASALEFLELHNILHLDIKPENIFMDKNGTFKIGDFGIAVYKNLWDWEEGDGRYLAPELLLENATATAAADVYSFGALLYECATGKCLPKSGKSITNNTLVSLPFISQEFTDMLHLMLSQSPKERPNASHIKAKCSTLLTQL